MSTVTTTHYLKIKPEWFGRVVNGEKRAEIRQHDRDFQVGDRLVLVTVDDAYALQSRDAQELLEPDRDYDPSQVTVQVLHVLPAHLTTGIAEGYVLLSIEVIA